MSKSRCNTPSLRTSRASRRLESPRKFAYSGACFRIEFTFLMHDEIQSMRSQHSFVGQKQSRSDQKLVIGRRARKLLKIRENSFADQCAHSIAKNFNFEQVRLCSWILLKCDSSRLRRTRLRSASMIGGWLGAPRRDLSSRCTNPTAREVQAETTHKLSSCFPKTTMTH